MFEHNHLYLYLISNERAKEWMRVVMNEGSLKIAKLDAKRNSRLSLKRRLLSILKIRWLGASGKNYQKPYVVNSKPEKPMHVGF